MTRFFLRQSSRGESMRILLALAFLFFSAGQFSVAFGQQSYIENGSFDTDVDGWTFIGEPGEALVWDDALGHPTPGSLRLTAVNSSLRGPVAVSECFDAPPGSSWHLEAFGREEANSVALGCILAFYVYEQSDCSNPIASSIVTGQQGAGLDWTPLDATFTIPEGYGGIQGVLVMGVDQSASGACNFDSVRLTGPPNFAEVPALGRHALAGLIAALALAGLFWLRRAY